MKRYALCHVEGGVLLRNLRTLFTTDRQTTADLLAHMAEVEARRLYAPAGCSSMYDFCVRELRMSDDEAYKRIRVARAARKFPAIFGAVAAGRLHVSGLVALAPFLTSRTAGELLTAAVHKTRREIEQLLAERFPKPDAPTVMQAIPEVPLSSAVTVQLAPGPVVGSADPTTRAACGGPSEFPGSATVAELAPGPVAETASPMERTSIMATLPASDPVEPVRARVAALSAERYALQLTISRGTREKLRRAEELLGHSVPSGDIAQVLDRALDALIQQLERQKCAATRAPRRAPKRASENPRHIPASVKRAVRKRDGDRCTFVSETGRRCAERKGLEYDHVEPVGRGGRATVASVRLMCRTHNQLEAERTYGVAFMNGKRERAAEARAQAASDGATASPPWT